VSETNPPERPRPSELASAWTLDPEVVFLNHGSFGACPRVVLEDQAALRARMEAEPVRFFVRELEGLMEEARRALADFVGADPSDLAFVNNATTGVNTVLASFPLQAGDELLTTDHEYNACRNALEAAAARAGASVVVASIPLPVASAEQAMEAILARVSSRTRLVLIDHITSQTGLVLPIERITAELEGRGVRVLVDGAHAPGMVELDVARVGASFYTGNCHKWLCAPKGAGFLWVREDWRERVRPLVISHGATAPVRDKSRFHLEFDWVGTDDPTAVLAIPVALETMASLVDGGWPEIRSRNRSLVLEGRRLLCEALALDPPCPEEMIGSLATLPLPDGSPEPPRSPLYLDPLQDELLGKHGIEVPVIPWPAPPRRVLRISAQLYNTAEQYRYLARVLPGLLGGVA
jgi:isopenicillin-N epimerase